MIRTLELGDAEIVEALREWVDRNHPEFRHCEIRLDHVPRERKGASGDWEPCGDRYRAIVTTEVS